MKQTNEIMAAYQLARTNFILSRTRHASHPMKPGSAVTCTGNYNRLQVHSISRKDHKHKLEDLAGPAKICPSHLSSHKVSPSVTRPESRARRLASPGSQQSL